MKNIFLQLKPKLVLKQAAIEKLLEIDQNEQETHPLLEQYFQNEEHTDTDNSQFVLTLIKTFAQPEIKDKLFSLLVFFVARLPHAASLSIMQSVLKSQESIFSKVRFFSLLYKSTTDVQIKKWLIINSINLIEQQSKISTFSNFVENFDLLLADLTFQENQFVEIYLKLINYLEKHIVYKKLWKRYIGQCLLKVTAVNAQSKEVDTLIVKLLKIGEVTQDIIALISQKNLNKNQFYPFLQTLLLGNYNELKNLDLNLLSEAGIKVNDLERKAKIQAIPRTLNGIKVAGYEQVANILEINKDEVESYIIEAIQEGLLKAKIDEFQETIIINNIKFRVLRPEQRANLQKSISTLASQLEQLA